MFMHNHEFPEILDIKDKGFCGRVEYHRNRFRKEQSQGQTYQKLKLLGQVVDPESDSFYIGTEDTDGPMG